MVKLSGEKNMWVIVAIITGILFIFYLLNKLGISIHEVKETFSSDTPDEKKAKNIEKFKSGYERLKDEYSNREDK